MEVGVELEVGMEMGQDEGNNGKWSWGWRCRGSGDGEMTGDTKRDGGTRPGLRSSGLCGEGCYT